MKKDEKICAVIVTVSDTRTEKDDFSGKALFDLLTENEFEVVDKIIVSDDLENLKKTLTELCEKANANLIFTVGGTGFAARDNTPEATLAVIEKEAPGLAEAMRFQTLKQTAKAMLSRGVCGIRAQSLIINLPGSEKAARECFEVIKPVLPHAVNLLKGNTKH